MKECKVFGAEITLVDGYISDCGAKGNEENCPYVLLNAVREGIPKNGWFEVSTMREPYRVEGKKTMAYEIVEQLDWKVPDVIIYATGTMEQPHFSKEGGGTGLIGMWKAFAEMEELGVNGYIITSLIFS